MNKPEFIKICGLSVNDAVDAAIEGGANSLGFVFFEKSPRNISFEQARKLSGHVNGRALKIAVCVNADDAMLDAIVDSLRPDMLQLHGSETPERVMEVKTRYCIPVIKALQVHDGDDLEKAKSYIGIADQFLFDAKPANDKELPGGNGVAFNWEVMDQWPSDVPYILSGGLNNSNIGTALDAVAPWGIDVSSGLEVSPGIKDNDLIEKFLKLIHEGQ